LRARRRGRADRGSGPRPFSSAPAGQKKTAGRSPPFSIPAFAPGLEVEGDTREDVAAETVIHLRVGVAVTDAGRAGVAADDRRIAIEDVIHAEAEVVVIADPGGQGQVEIF